MRIKKECHPRGSGDPENLIKTLDSRFRGNDKTLFTRKIIRSGYSLVYTQKSAKYMETSMPDMAVNAKATATKTQKLRFVTAASLFDGHDVSINIIRRILQSKGVEVIHLGHNRSAQEIVTAALQEDVHAIAISSYQGGHLEYFKYIIDLLRDNNADDIRVFGGGGGVITKDEIKELHDYGVARIYSPEDGQTLG